MLYNCKVINCLNISKTITLHKICVYNKVIDIMQPLYLHKKITVSSNIHNINIRKKTLIYQCILTLIPTCNKQRDDEQRFVTCDLLLQRQKRKGFLHRVVNGDENWIHYYNPERKKSWGKPVRPYINIVSSSAKPNIHRSKLLLCIWCDQLR